MERTRIRKRTCGRNAAVMVGCVLAALAAGLPGGCGGDGSTKAASAATSFPKAEPVTAGWEGTKNVSRTDRFTFAAQPTEASLRHFAGEGGKVVLDMRTQQGTDVSPFDEKARVEALGMKYVHVPMTPDSFSRADVRAFAEATKSHDGPILVHCGSSNRVGGMWAAYLATECGVPVEEAIVAGKAAGMKSPEVEAAARRVIAQ